ncbi:MAG: LAGLIDADG family homing endonuclease [Betaproteobacteria bacterium]
MKLDNAQTLLDEQPISVDVLLEKYAKGEEKSIDDVRRRVARGLAAVEKPALRAEWEARFHQAMVDGFIPGGRVNSAAGTGIAATLINCFVQPVGDAITQTRNGVPSIYGALAQAAETMRRGGGVGYDFSAIRPKGAMVHGTHSRASGPMSYMRVFDKSCETLESAGARRGAQMGMIRCDHPDVEEFIHAKRDGSLTNFNMSVAVTDAFMQAVERDEEIELTHVAEPFDKASAYQRADGSWVYRKLRARDLFDQIMRSTYNHAEPGVIFIDRVNQDNNLNYCETIAATNPCVTADTRLHTQYGMVRIGDLHASGAALAATVDLRSLPQGDANVRGTTVRPAVPAFMTASEADVYRVVSADGYEIKATAWHDFYTTRGKLKLAELKPGDELLVQSGKGQFGSEGSAELGELIGLIAGDGHFTNRGNGLNAAVVNLWGADRDLAPRVVATINALIAGTAATARAYAVKPVAVPERNLLVVRSVLLARLLTHYGFTAASKHSVPELIWRGSEDCVRGYLRALFQTDGTVNISTSSNSCSIRLASSEVSLLKDVQVLLANFGVFCRIHRRRAAGTRQLPDGRGGQRDYACRADYELIVDGESRERFMAEIGFMGEAKAAKYRGWVQGKALRKTQRFTTRIERSEYAGREAVYDTTQPDGNAVIFNGLVTGQCGEQPLPPYGCCCLGSINLTRFVIDPFGSQPTFDFAKFAQVVKVSIRALDNVLEATLWPLQEQQAEAAAKRRVGLGFTGLGNTLTMLNLRYDSDAARAMAGDISRAMRDASYEASAELAQEKGKFPLFDADKYLAEPHCAARLPEPLKARIRKHGIRNSHLLSIAPTGTISLAFAGNASGGIEPTFSWTYVRKKRMPDGSKQEYAVEDYAYRLFKLMGGDTDRLPAAFVHALEMSATDHLKMIAAVQPYIDAAVSKTVNVPEDYPFDDFRNLYFQAWKAGLKGITTYRPNNVIGSVLEVKKETPEAQASPQDLKDDPDRRVRLQTTPQPALASLKWPGRPELAQGNMAWTYMVEIPERKESFAIFIGQVENGRGPQPFEVWVNGSEQPRGLGAISKALSMDMRSEDRAWLKMKLDALAKARDEQGFFLKMPPNGDALWQSGVVAAFANIVRWRCDTLGTFTDIGSHPTPVLDALFSKKEPKAGPLGTMSWTVDVENPGTGDDFVLGVKELHLPDGSRRPYSIWLAGEYPKVLDGLCKLISLDMRVVDANWIGLKLKKLLNFGEQNGEFWAPIPGEDRSAMYPSTVAYIATLLLHRYKVLGLLDDEGRALQAAGILAVPDMAHEHIRHETSPVKGKVCPSCHAAAMIKRDGCEFCTACGYTGACG